jgi:hypothetical protein
MDDLVAADRADRASDRRRARGRQPSDELVAAVFREHRSEYLGWPGT